MMARSSMAWLRLRRGKGSAGVAIEAVE